MKNNKNTRIEDAFFCYSLRVFHHLRSCNLNYLYKEVHPVSNRTYWVFPRNKELDLALTKFKKQKEDYLANK